MTKNIVKNIMKDIGKMIVKMALEKKNGREEVIMKVNIKMELIGTRLSNIYLMKNVESEV